MNPIFRVFTMVAPRLHHLRINIIFDNIGDNKDILKKGVESLLKYNNRVELRTIRPRDY